MGYLTTRSVLIHCRRDGITKRVELDRARAIDLLPRDHRSVVHHQSTHDRTHGGDRIRRRFTASGIHPGLCGIATTGPDLPTPCFPGCAAPGASLHEACTEPWSRRGAEKDAQMSCGPVSLVAQSVPNHVRRTNRLPWKRHWHRCLARVEVEPLLFPSAGVMAPCMRRAFWDGNRVVQFCQSVVCQFSCPFLLFLTPSTPSQRPDLKLWSSSWDAQTHHMHLGGAGNGWGATCICIWSVSHLSQK